jgi:hypothetical protein
MGSLAVLDHTHFTLQRIGEKLSLCSKLPGISMVLFWTKDCEFCEDHKVIFKELPNRVPNIKFGTCNIGISARGPDGNIVDKPVHRMSVGTSTPINYVPLVISYINNKPYKIYEGERSMAAVLRFVTQILQDVQKGSSKPKTENEGLVETYGAIPKNKVNRCYLSIENAYGGNTEMGTNHGKKRTGSYSYFGDAYGINDEEAKNMDMTGRS